MPPQSPPLGPAQARVWGPLYPTAPPHRSHSADGRTEAPGAQWTCPRGRTWDRACGSSSDPALWTPPGLTPSSPTPRKAHTLPGDLRPPRHRRGTRVRAPGAGRGPGLPEAARDLTCSEQVCAKVRSWVHVGAALVCGHTEPRASARRWGWGSTAGLGGEGDGTGSGERASLGEQPRRLGAAGLGQAGPLRPPRLGSRPRSLSPPVPGHLDKHSWPHPGPLLRALCSPLPPMSHLRPSSASHPSSCSSPALLGSSYAPHKTHDSPFCTLPCLLHLCLRAPLATA